MTSLQDTTVLLKAFQNASILVLNKIIVVIRVISDVIERDLFNPINLLNEPGLIFYVVLKFATLVPRPGSFRPKCQKSFED